MDGQRADFGWADEADEDFFSEHVEWDDTGWDFPGNHRSETVPVKDPAALRRWLERP